jgi:trigger factor
METLEQPLTTKVKTVKEEPCEITLSIELPKDEVAREADSVYRSIQSRASLPGFRTGKAPMDMVKQNFSDRARQMLIENLIGRAAAQVLREKKLQSLDTPKVEKLDFDWGKPLTFVMRVERDPEIKAKNYKGIKVNRPSDKIKDDAVENELKSIQDRNATLAAADVAVSNANFAVIDFEGKIDGKTFKGGTAKDYLIDMAQPQTIAGFSEGLLGGKAGEEREIPVTFPADYGHKEFAGKKAQFHVKIKEVKEKKLPALDDDFAKDLGLASLAELKQKIQENLQHGETEKADKEVEDQLYQALLDEHSFAVPPTLVEERNRVLTQRALYNLARQGLVSADDAQAQATLKEKTRPQAEKDVRLSYLLKAIATQEKLDAVDADVEDLKKKALSDKDAKAAEVEKYFQERDISIRASITEGKVLDFLKKNAKIKTA